MNFNQFIKIQTILFLGLLVIPAFAQEKDIPNEITPDKTILYKSTKQGELELHVFLPKGHQPSDKNPAVVFFFGGGWSGGTTKQFYAQAEALAAEGAVAFCADYRVKKKHNTTPFEAVKDAKSSIRWVRTHATEWGVDPNRIVASGGSAGGHLAACTGIIEGYEEEEGASSLPNAMVLFNPVLDTTEKGYGRKKFTEEEHLLLSPCHQVKKDLVPTIVFHGTADATVPFENAERFTKLMKKAGNDCVLKSYPDAGHGFFNSKHFRPKTKDDSAYHETLAQMIQFLRQNKILTP